jgi:hypothetical protein
LVFHGNTGDFAPTVSPATPLLLHLANAVRSLELPAHAELLEGALRKVLIQIVRDLRGDREKSKAERRRRTLEVAELVSRDLERGLADVVAVVCGEWQADEDELVCTHKPDRGRRCGKCDRIRHERLSKERRRKQVMQRA